MRSMKKKTLIWKMLLTVVLLLTLLFIYNQRSNFLISMHTLNGREIKYVEATKIKAERRIILNDHTSYDDYEHFAAKAHSVKKLEMGDGERIEQSFVAVESRVEQVNLYIYNPAGYTSEGVLTVSLETMDGEVLGTTQLDVSKVANAAPTLFSFTGKTERLNANETATAVRASATENKYGIHVQKGETYKVVLEADGIESDVDLAVYLMDDDTSDAYDLIAGGETVTGGHLFAGIIYREFAWSIFLVFVAGILFAVLFVWIPWDHMSAGTNRWLADKTRIRVNYNKIILWLMFLLTPFYNFLILMKVANMYVNEALGLFFSFRGLLNLMLIGAIWWTVYILLNRKRWSAMLVTTICTIFGLVNFALLQFRDSPLIATDIANVGTAMQVTQTYQLEITKSALWAIMLYAIWMCALLSLKEERGPRLPVRLVHVLIGAVWLGGAWHVMFDSTVIKDHQIKLSSFRPSWNYKKNGYMLSFWVSVGMSYVEKPANYSVSEVEKLTEQYVSDPAVETTGTTRETPNILVVMNESYSDLAANGSFETNQDYMPFYRSLTENTIKGTAHSSVYGGTTADSEFEFLTGFTMKFLPFHSVPFTNLIKSELPNLTYQLKDIGYSGNIAFHPGMENSYNRNNVYPLLGFDDHISIEDIEEPEYIRAYLSDQSDYEEVFRQYEAHLASEDGNDPFYMFNVTIQNHGSYTLDNGVVDANISITDDALQYSQAINYLNLIKKSDEALEELITYFSEVEEPTVIVLYGDHQPRVDSAFYSNLYALNDESKLSSLMKSERKYRVPFMIWANFDIEEQTDVDLSINYLSSYMKEALGLPMTGFDKYLMDLYQELPVITAIAVKDSEGNYYAADDETPYEDLLLTYQQIQYNGFMDTGGRLDDFFNLAETENESQ